MSKLDQCKNEARTVNLGKHTIVFEIEPFKITNPLGFYSMRAFAYKIVNHFDFFDFPITFVIRGLPYADFDVHYTVDRGKHDYGNGFLVGLVMYPAGFAFRKDVCFSWFDPIVSELLSILNKILKENEKGAD